MSHCIINSACNFIVMSERDWPVVFFSLNVLVRFWYQGHAGLKKQIEEFYSLQEFLWGSCYFFFKYLVEYFGEDLWGLSSFVRKVLNVDLIT